MRQIGKVGKEWARTRKEWVKLNPPNHQGYYVCFYCAKWVPREEITVDHKLSRSRNPELRADLDNLVPACWPCNQKKGSTSVL